MTITPNDLIPSRATSSIERGRVESVGNGMATVTLQSGQTLVAQVPGGNNYVIGQIVTVQFFGQDRSQAQVMGSAAGSRQRVRQVCVKIGE